MARDKFFFWDLDGPILNVKEKYYCVYRNLITDAGYEALDKQEYWDAKRSKVSEIEILSRTGAADFFEIYHKARLSLIENPDYLSLDTLQEGAREVLAYFSTRFQLVLVTLRSSSRHLNKGLKKLGIKKYFVDILTSGDKYYPRWRIKHQLVKEYLRLNNSPGLLIIGDTETDIIAGNILGFKTIAVLNGIRSKDLILKAEPCFVVESVQDLLNPEWLDRLKESTE